MMISLRPEATASSTTYWIIGLSTSGSISFGWALVAGRKRVPRPAAAKAVGIGYEERADLEGGAVHQRHQPGKVQPRPGNRGRAIEPERERDQQRQERLHADERCTAHEDSDGQGQRDARRRIVEREH